MIRFDTEKDIEHYDNLYHQIIEKDKQLEKYKNVIDKIKEIVSLCNTKCAKDILELLEEVE